jgi:hypothetical protein
MKKTCHISSMTGYAKIFQSIFKSSIWDLDPVTKLIWISLVIMSDKDGYIKRTPSGLAKEIGVSQPELEAALEIFKSPDPLSSTPDNEGRRISMPSLTEIYILNKEIYKERMSEEDRRRQKTEWQANDRAKKKREKQSMLPTEPEPKF